MTRVVYSRAEWEKEKDKWKLNGEARLSFLLDTQEHGNSYMIGRALGMASQDIVLVGQNGARVSAIPKQFERIFEMSTTTLPPLVTVSFTANDFCQMGIFSEEVAHRQEQFAKSLNRAWNETKRFLIPHPRGTTILVMAPLEVANILTNASLMEQQIEFEGQSQFTCGHLRRGEYRRTYLADLLVQKLGEMCKSVLLTNPNDEQKISRLRQVQTSFNEVWKKQIADLNAEYASHNIKWIYVESIPGSKLCRG